MVEAMREAWDLVCGDIVTEEEVEAAEDPTAAEDRQEPSAA